MRDTLILYEPTMCAQPWLLHIISAKVYTCVYVWRLSPVRGGRARAHAYTTLVDGQSQPARVRARARFECDTGHTQAEHAEIHSRDL